MSSKFYLKVAFQNKIKKYSIQSLTEIKFSQIKGSLGLTQKWRDSLFFYEIVEDFNNPTSELGNYSLFTEQDLIKHLAQSATVPNSTIKLRILQRTLMSEEERRRKESEESFELPEKMQKKRSKSLELEVDLFDETCKTQLFDITTNFIVSGKNEQVNQQFPSQRMNTNSFKSYSVAPFQSGKLFAKSTQVSTDQCAFSNKDSTGIISSVSSSMDYDKIKNCLHQSLKISQKQKTQLQKLKEKIAKRQHQRQLEKQEKRQSVIEVLDMFGIDKR